MIAAELDRKVMARLYLIHGKLKTVTNHNIDDKNTYNTVRKNFNGIDKEITIEEFCALPMEDIEELMKDAGLDRLDQSKLYTIHKFTKTGMYIFFYFNINVS